jgi:membrane protein
LNAIWSVKTKPSRSGWMLLIMQRLVSFAMVVTIGFLLMVSLIVTTALASLTSRFDAGVLAHALDFSVALIVVTLLFALVFKVLPDVELRWRDVWLGAFVTSLLFAGGRYLIALYLGHSTVASIYGAAGSLVALLIWVYYSCAIMFYGVEFTKAYRAQRKVKLVPKETAVVVREQVIEKPIRPQPRSA